MLYIFILQKRNKPQDGFCTHLLFASAIILIFDGIFLHRLSRILKIKLKWLRVSTADFASKNAEIEGRIQIQVNPVVRQEIIRQKVTPKTDPLSSAKFQRMGYAIYSFQ